MWFIIFCALAAGGLITFGLMRHSGTTAERDEGNVMLVIGVMVLVALFFI